MFFPWITFWSPQIYLPWSGSVAQDVHPNTSWFAQNIKGSAGDPNVEQAAFSIASYGKQLGLITEVLLALAEQNTHLDPKAQESVDRLRKIQSAIETIKSAAEIQ